MSTEDQQAPKKLTVPTCTLWLNAVIKVNEIEPGEHGYNVYVKVLKCENGKDTLAGKKVIYCTVGDDTAQARASFVEPPADLLKEGNVIAIRNGLSQVIREQIELRIDA